jgi:ribosomal-protein-alanine N-acetyltransferase
MSTPILHTTRLDLRPLTISDAPAIQEHFDNWNIIQYLTNQVPWPYPADGAQTFITDIVRPAYETEAALIWAITEPGIDLLIGCINFTFDDTGVGNRGFWLAEPFWGRGYMTEAVEAVQDHVLLDLGVERMVVLNAVTNPASRRIKEKTGARLVGQIELAHHNGETLSDQWEVTRSDWAQRRNRPLTD